MEVGRFLGALQLAVSVIAPSLLPFIGTDAVIVLLAVSNALGGVAHIYGWSVGVANAVRAEAVRSGPQG